ncbi:MAG: peptidase [Cyanobacteria bacterium RYN_339]|nr:peptidase [Cyanobacteria bacterium RYN_339]
MKKLPLLALLAVLSGCGTHTNVAGTAAPVSAESASIMAAGVDRKLDYDWDRYKNVLAPKAKPHRVPRQGILPASADLRATLPPVYDQGHLGACTAFACAKGMRETLQRQNHERVVPLSALFEYYETRAHMPLVGWIMKHLDSGGTITEAVSILATEGAAPEDSFPYDVTKFKEKPPAASYKAAPEFKLHTSTQLAGLDDVKSTLAKGRTVAFGFRVYESFRGIGADGVMPVPGAQDKLLGGHAVLAVGYDDAKKALIVRNSWSPTWGDKGYFYMPYEVAGNASMATDFWTGE